MIILSLPLIQEGQMSVSGETMLTILINHLENWACPVKEWLGIKIDLTRYDPFGLTAL